MSADHLARQVGLDLAPARRAVEQRRGRPSSSRTPQPLPQVAHAPHAAQREHVGRRDDEHLGGHLGARSRVASVATAPMSTTVSACRALTAARTLRATPRVDVLGALALLGRQQQPEALLVRVERLLQVAHGDLVRDVDEVDDAAPVGRVQQRAEVALLEVEVDQADRPAGRHPRGGERRGAARRWSCRRRPWSRPTATSWPPSAPLADSSPVTRSRIVRDHCEAARTLASKRLERQRQRDDVAQAGLHGGAQQARRVVGGEQDQPDLGERRRRCRARRRAPARRRARRGAARRRRRAGAARACSSSSVGDDVDDLELGLAGERRRAAGGLVVGDGDQQPGAHWSSRRRPLRRVARP